MIGKETRLEEGKDLKSKLFLIQKIGLLQNCIIQGTITKFDENNTVFYSFIT